MSRPSRILAVVVLAVLAIARPAGADSGNAEDARDGRGAIDVSRVSHTNDDDLVTYRLETYEPFAIGDVFQVSWEFDFNSDGNPSDACALMKRIGSTNILRASFYSDCGPETWATADATIGDRSIEFSLPLIDLVEGGGMTPGDDYSYRVTAVDRDGVEDTAPDRGLVAHADVPVPTARPGSAETQLGFQGDTAGTGAGGSARTAEQARAEGAIGASEDAASSASSKGPEFRFGPVPVCSGSFCFALGVGAPALAAFIFVLVRGAIRRRRLPALPEPTAWVQPTDAVPEPRSYPRNT